MLQSTTDYKLSVTVASCYINVVFLLYMMCNKNVYCVKLSYGNCLYNNY